MRRCGDGAYLAELNRRGHAGRMLGADLSTGMLHAARRRTPAAARVAGDAAARPLHEHAAQTLATHMLYHVPDSHAAIRELRRVTRPGGQALVVLNGHDHLQDLRDLIAATLQITTGEQPLGEQLRLDDGQDLLASQFSHIIRHDFSSELRIPGRGPIEDYVRSMISTQARPDTRALASAVASRVSTSKVPFRVRVHTGCLVCT